MLRRTPCHAHPKKLVCPLDLGKTVRRIQLPLSIMPKINVRKSCLINAPLDKVYQTVRDFHQWPRWSPWLITDPDCQVTYADDGKQYAWEGPVVGSGEMAVRDETPGGAIQYQLTFFKPWKSRAAVQFSFEESHSEGVQVTWSMQSSLPFFLFFMRKMMTAFIGMDYERGLTMLKDQLELGTVPSRLEFPGIGDFAGSPFIGIRTQCPIAEIGPAMESDLQGLKTWFENHPDDCPSGKPFSQYHDWDVVKNTTKYTIGFPLAALPEESTDGFVCGQIPTCQTFAIKHTGPYRHLGNAWSAGFFRVRNKLIQQDKKITPFETYETAPDEGAEEDTVTTVHFPVKQGAS